VSAAPALSNTFTAQRPAAAPAPPVGPDSVAEKVRIGGSATVGVVARSMSPWVRPGDQVFIRRYDFLQIAPGDIILYERANRLFIHRVVKRVTRPNLEGNASFLIVKSDNADRSGAPVSAREFLGRAIRIHRGKRHIDLESFSRKVLGKILAQISSWFQSEYRPISQPQPKQT
jgi:hypothetical protein